MDQHLNLQLPAPYDPALSRKVSPMVFEASACHGRHMQDWKLAQLADSLPEILPHLLVLQVVDDFKEQCCLMAGQRPAVLVAACSCSWTGNRRSVTEWCHPAKWRPEPQ